MRHLKIYRAIREIHRHGSIRRAAEVLAVSPSALNRSVQAFEDELGAPVFDRLPRGVELSAAGELLITLVERHLVEFTEFQSQTQRLQDGITGDVSLSISDDLNAGVLLSAVADFEAEFPGLSVLLESDNTSAKLKQRRVDIAVMTNPDTDEGVEVLYSQTIGIGAWIGPGFEAVSGIWDLVDDRLVLPPDGTGTRAVFRHVLRRHRLEERTITTAAASHMGALILAGHRSAIAPVIAIQPNQPPLGFPRLAVTIGDVQVSILRASGVPMKKAAEALSLRLQAALDANAPGYVA